MAEMLFVNNPLTLPAIIPVQNCAIDSFIPGVDSASNPPKHREEFLTAQKAA
jgi:hypothetical protein